MPGSACLPACCWACGLPACRLEQVFCLVGTLDWVLPGSLGVSASVLPLEFFLFPACLPACLGGPGILDFSVHLPAWVLLWVLQISLGSACHSGSVLDYCYRFCTVLLFTHSCVSGFLFLVEYSAATVSCRFLPAACLLEHCLPAACKFLLDGCVLGAFGFLDGSLNSAVLPAAAAPATAICLPAWTLLPERSFLLAGLPGSLDCRRSFRFLPALRSICLPALRRYTAGTFWVYLPCCLLGLPLHCCVLPAPTPYLPLPAYWRL